MRSLRIVANYFSLQLALAGAALVVAGFLLGTGVVAGMLPIWGAGLLLVGLTAFTITWTTRH